MKFTAIALVFSALLVGCVTVPKVAPTHQVEHRPNKQIHEAPQAQPVPDKPLPSVEKPSEIKAVSTLPAGVGLDFAPFGTNGENMVRTFYVTDRSIERKVLRKKTTSGELSLDIDYSSRQARSLLYGVVHVSIPKVERKPGAILRPNWLVLDFEDPKKHFMLRGHRLFGGRGSFFDELKYSAEGSQRKAFLFVHGYNVSFEDAAYRTAQIAVDMAISAVPIFYSWPSRSKVLPYTYDSTSVQRTEPKLKSFLEALGTQAGLDEIYVLAHSMGTFATTRALRDVMAARPDLRRVFKQIVLAAPDIDAEVFKTAIAPDFLDPRLPVTMYVSDRDKALQASKGINGDFRLGDRRAGPVIMPGLITIDASKVDTDFLGHSYVGGTRSLLADLALLFGQGLPAEKRPMLRQVSGPSGSYWEMQ